MSGVRLVSALASAIVLSGTGGAAAERIPGDLWESTVQMSAEGMESMAMPPMTQRFCSPKGDQWTEPPGAMQDESCEAVEWRMSGSKATWSIRCKDGTTGTGEMTFEGRESYRGAMTIRSSEGTMVMKMSGKRIGDCDYGETARQIAAIERQAEQAAADQNEAVARMCREAAAGVAIDMFVPPASMCSSPEHKAALCAALETEKGFAGVAGRTPEESPQLAKASEFCGVDPEEVRNRVCKTARANRSYTFLTERCPAEAKALAEAECAGRKFTAIPEADLRGFCMTYAAEAMAAQPPPEEKKESKTKKALKGLLGR